MAQAQELLSQMYFKIGGKNASPKMMHDLREIEVDTSLHLPDMFTIHLDDPTLDWIDSPLLDIGKLVGLIYIMEIQIGIIFLVQLIKVKIFLLCFCGV